MVTIDEALRHIREHSRPLPPRRVPLLDALGCRLAETIVVDADSPPFDKALVDGFAVDSASVSGLGSRRLRIVEEVTAGKVPSHLLRPGETAFIMTGAPLPVGADAVVMHEKTERLGRDEVLISGPIEPGAGRMSRGREMRARQTLFRPGTVLSAASLGVLASVGRSEVEVTPRPLVAILPTGDELVPIASRPGPGQIRETNSTMLAALIVGRHCHPLTFPTAPDDADALKGALAQAIASEPDILLVCGGVSAGTRDLVPAALQSLGFVTVFHKVRLKPGKPLLFAVGPRRGDRGGILAFGLPGNPVSSLIGHLLFVDPAMQRMSGEDESSATLPSYPLLAAFQHRGDRPTYHPARIVKSGRGRSVEAMDWAGSADLFTVSRSDGFLRFPEGDRRYEPGERVDFLPFGLPTALPFRDNPRDRDHS